MSPLRHNRTVHLFAWFALVSAFLLLLTFLTASSLGSAPNARIVKKLNLNDRLTVKGKGCQPQVQSQADAKIVVRCVKNKAQSAEPNTPDAKITLALRAGDKLIVKRKTCRLQVTSLSNTRVWILCDKGPLAPIVPDTTKPLSSDTTQYLTSVSPDGAAFTFSQATDQLNALQVGDIMVSNPAQAAPDGFLRKVDSIQNNGGQIVVQTQATTIADAVQQGEISVSQVLQPTNLERATFAKGVTMVKRPDAPNSFYLQLNDVVLYDEDGNTSTTNDQIVGNGNITLDPRFDFRLKVENFQLKELYFTTTAQETSNLTIESRVVASASKETTLATYPLGPLFLTIGPVPVTVYPIITITAGIDGSIYAGVSTGATQSLTETAGVSYANSAWSPIQQLTNQFTYEPPTLSAGLAIKGYTGAKLKILFYGSVGPDIALNAYLKLDANSLETPWWKLYGGLEVPVGISIDVFSHVVAGWNAVVIDFKKVIAQAQSSPPTATSTLTPTQIPTVTATAPSTSTSTATPTATSISPTNTPTPTPTAILTNTPTPTPTPTNIQAISIAAGDYHICALTIISTIKCWGTNWDGELGDGNGGPGQYSWVPVDVLVAPGGVPLSGIAMLSNGNDNDHTCAVTDSGGVKCWGQNSYGELGDGTTINRYTPVDVSGLTSGVNSVSVGGHQSCALLVNGIVKCWGWNGHGQLGDGTTSDHLTPVTVANLSNASAISVGGVHACAIAAGNLKCWGYNEFGQLGDGTTTDRHAPVDISELSGLSEVSAGEFHTCVIVSGSVKCWGYNYYGQLGDGTTTDRHTPIDVNGLSGVATIESINHHTCTLSNMGAAKCWGSNFEGELGDGTTTPHYTPADVSGLTSGVDAIIGGDIYTCALVNNGVKCWGSDEEGQLGDDGTAYPYSTTPVDVVGFGP